MADDHARDLLRRAAGHVPSQPPIRDIEARAAQLRTRRRTSVSLLATALSAVTLLAVVGIALMVPRLRGDSPAVSLDSGGEQRIQGQAEPRPTTPVTDVPSAVRVRSFVADFLARRVDGRGAERFLAPDAEDQFGRSGGLAPLYIPSHTGSTVEFVDGPLGPGASYEVGVRLLRRERRAVAETLFVDWVADEDRLVVSGGRPGLTGP